MRVKDCSSLYLHIGMINIDHHRRNAQFIRDAFEHVHLHDGIDFTASVAGEDDTVYAPVFNGAPHRPKAKRHSMRADGRILHSRQIDQRITAVIGKQIKLALHGPRCNRCRKLKSG